MPHVIVVAGPNGAGKSTAAPRLLRDTLAVTEFVNADAIAGGLSAFRPESVAIAAGRIMLARMRALAKAGVSFAFETILASRSFVPWLTALRRQGYRIEVIFLWLESADLAVSRVAARVRLGGHDVPEAIVRRRYDAGLRNLFARSTCRSRMAGGCSTTLGPVRCSSSQQAPGARRRQLRTARVGVR